MRRQLVHRLCPVQTFKISGSNLQNIRIKPSKFQVQTLEESSVYIILSRRRSWRIHCCSSGPGLGTASAFKKLTPAPHEGDDMNMHSSDVLRVSSSLAFGILAEKPLHQSIFLEDLRVHGIFDFLQEPLSWLIAVQIEGLAGVSQVSGVARSRGGMWFAATSSSSQPTNSWRVWFLVLSISLSALCL